MIESNLKWHPYVGSYYHKGIDGLKVLIIGESHYKKPGSKADRIAADPHFTIKIVKEMGEMKEYDDIKMFKNFHMTMVGSDEFDHSRFWKGLSFYNFIQRAMDSNKGRPNKEDYLNGWSVFPKVIQELSPDICIFIGVKAYDFMKRQIKKESEVHILKSIKSRDKISNTYPRYAKINCSGKVVDAYFIRHTSKYYSWRKWRSFLFSSIPELMAKWSEMNQK
ncbi:MAG: hypothetical protein RI562_08915 [Salibacter sp.]|uniref:hypothetical protein n=1 Tax=Salibacter sp. TaxID=2010995 RepID=UPI0028705F7D|nr:hypothetical protein [Salibacter sp.]MDR9399171.1 hypothetical protein [Salibacter sp.]